MVQLRALARVTPVITRPSTAPKGNVAFWNSVTTIAIQLRFKQVGIEKS